jgi:hypothetical protein
MATKMSRLESGSVINWPLVSGYKIQDYGSMDMNPKEIFTDLHSTTQGKSVIELDKNY